MENNAHQAIQIPTQISEEKNAEKRREIQRRLQSAEAQKARRLLTLAFSNFEAMKIVRDGIEKEVLNGHYDAGHRLFKK